MQLKTLYGLLVDELRGLYVAESLVQEAGARLRIGAHADPLKDALGILQTDAGRHMQRLEKMFSLLGENPRGGSAEAVKAILETGEERVGSPGDPRVIDASVILVARRLQSWQVATYGTLERYALRAGLEEVAELLEQSLNEERTNYTLLGELAEEMELKGSREA